MQDTPSVSDLRRANRNRVYRFLFDAQEPRTVQDVARGLSLSLPTVNQNLGELLELGLIEYTGIANSSGGRRPRVLSARPGARWAVGVELSPHHVRAVAIDLAVRELGQRAVSRLFSRGEEYAGTLAEDLRAFIAEVGAPEEALLGVGITVPGIVDPGRNVLEYAPTMGPGTWDLSGLAAAMPWPVRFCNDASAGGYAEWRDRPNLDSIAYLSLSRGVGGAILIDGRPYEGMRRRSGEFGHMCIRPQGRRCVCGRRGCLEAYCSAAAISDDMGITLGEFFQGVSAGELEKVGLWQHYLENLAVGVCNIRTALDCGVVLGGTVSQHMEPHLQELYEAVEQCGGENPAEWLHLSRYHGRSNAIGAALLWVDDFLNTV